MKIWLKRLLIGVTILVSGLFVGLYFVFPYSLVDIKHSPKYIPQNHKKYTDTQQLSIQTADNLTQFGTLFFANQGTSTHTIILVHGIRARQDIYFDKARDIAKNWNVNVLVVDLRGHGLSEGSFATFGVKEKLDIGLWINEIEKILPTTKIGIWGQSYGGAVALQTMALDKRIAYGIVESTFSELKNVGPDYIERWLGLRWNWLNSFFTWRIESIADFSVDDANPKKACYKINQPIVLAHGVEDDRIKFSYCQENFDALSSTSKTLISVPKAKHHNLWSIAGTEYQNRIKAFILSQ